MPVFKYEALNSSGQEIKDEIEAPSKEEAVSRVRGLGYFPTKVVEKADRRQTAATRAGPGACWQFGMRRQSSARAARDS